jgi:cysteine desulfurase/selenocysteine lyase
LGAAIDYLESLSLERIEATEHALLEYAVGRLAEVPGLRLIGSAAERSSVISFMLGNVHPHDVGTVLDTHGVAIRAGHHCAQPLMDALGVPGTARASLAVYNTREEVDRMVVALHAVRGIFG